MASKTQRFVNQIARGINRSKGCTADGRFLLKQVAKYDRDTRYSFEILDTKTGVTRAHNILVFMKKNKRSEKLFKRLESQLKWMLYSFAASVAWDEAMGGF